MSLAEHVLADQVRSGSSWTLQDGDTRIWFGGGKLARDLTFPNLRQFWELTAGDRKGQSPNGALPSRLPREEKPSPVARTTGNGHWRASRGPRRSSGQSRSPTSPRGGAARETAGVFAAWSRRFEGDSPGPMAAAADALARSAQNRPDDPVPNREAVRDFRGVVAIVAQSELNNDSPMVWAMLVDQFVRTLRAISDTHVARGRQRWQRR